MKALLLSCILAAGASVASATIITSFEAAGAQSTTVAGTIMETFDGRPQNAPLGVFVSTIGTYSAGAEVVAPDVYGGANSTRYVSVGAQSGTLSYSLTFGSLQQYFGLYWAAGDPNNRLDFYKDNGTTLIQTIAVSDFIGSLSAAYFGNPNTNGNTNEPYVFINFTSNAVGTNFDKVVFRNLSTGSGFESDNHTILSGVPEPSSYAMMIAGLSMLALGRFLRRKQGSTLVQ